MTFNKSHDCIALLLSERWHYGINSVWKNEKISLNLHARKYFRSQEQKMTSLYHNFASKRGRVTSEGEREGHSGTVGHVAKSSLHIFLNLVVYCQYFNRFSILEHYSNI